MAPLVSDLTYIICAVRLAEQTITSQGTKYNYNKFTQHFLCNQIQFLLMQSFFSYQTLVYLLNF